MTIRKARELRSHLTEAESFLWMHLRYRQIGGYKFRREHPVGQYIVDFACLEKKLILEVDGGQHAQRVEDDNIRTEWLQSQGYKPASSQVAAAAAPAANGNGAAPVCEYHGAMKASTKVPGTWYCPGKLADGSYCKSKA